MTGRGGVHEVASERLAAVPADELEGIAHPVLFREDDTADAADAADRHDRHDRHDRLSSHDFESHVEYPLHNSSLEDPDAARSLHVLRLRPRLARRILEDPHTARRGKRPPGIRRAGATRPRSRGRRRGVQRRRIPELARFPLEPNTWCYTSDEDEDGDGDDGEDNGDGTRPRRRRHRRRRQKVGVCSARLRAAHERVRDENRGERAITLEDLYGWLNANEGGDFNKLHEHGGADSWSGVFTFGARRPLSHPSLGLRPRLRLRLGKTRTAWEPWAYDATSPRDRRARRRCRILLRAEGRGPLLFRGDVLHAVESNGWARGGAGREARDVDMQTVRLSVAFNEDSLANDKKVAERRGEVGKGVARGDVYAPPGTL